MLQCMTMMDTCKEQWEIIKNKIFIIHDLQLCQFKEDHEDLKGSIRFKIKIQGLFKSKGLSDLRFLLMNGWSQIIFY